MKKISFRNILAGLAVCSLFSLPFVSCANLSDSESNSVESSIEYGSITISGGNPGSRALDVDSLTSANVTVSGYGIKDIVKNDVSISAGKAEGITIEKIPVGRRVVTVKSNVDGAVLRAVCDIVAGSNSVTVNWASTAVGNVYYYLAQKQEIASVEKSVFENAIPAVHASLVNAEAIANDIAALKDSSNYILDYGTVKLNYKNTNGYTVQVTDIASAKTTFSAANGTETLKGYPGEWKVKVFDEAGILKSAEDVLIGAGKETEISLEYGEGIDLTGKTIIFVKAEDYVPYLYAWISNPQTELTGGWSANSAMTAVTSDYMKDPAGWYMRDITNTYGNSTGKINFILLSDATTKKTGDLTGAAGTFWYDSSASTTNPSPVVAGLKVSVENPQLPVAPAVTISPAKDKISVNSSITVSLTNGYDTISDASVSITGDVTNTYSYSDFTDDVLTIEVGEGGLGITEAGKSITVNASVTNSKGTANATATYTTNVTKEDPFTWDNVNAYFVLTDRFANGDTGNDHSYYRQNKDNNSALSGNNNVATFHGGDIKGLTEKIDYLDKLGVNAIWITAPYEQAHGWVAGKNNAFPHYAFHGYYTLDWTSMDQNMGTVEELRTFVNACHSKGIRVIMDVVMNHVGYNNNEDMFTYGYGTCKHQTHGWLEKTNGEWNANEGISNDDWKNFDAWDKWFGPWIRSFRYNTGSEYGGSCGGLPDVKTELENSVGMAPVLVTKWDMDSSDVKEHYWNPSVEKADWNGYSGDYRTDRGIAPADYQVVWLSAWVRELGIDGFRCDTAKHVEPKRWGQLKKACTEALKKWREDSKKSKLYNGVDTGAADWDESFWMTGECFGWQAIDGQGEYYTTGGFDSMINFSIGGGDRWDAQSYHNPSISSSTWGSYLNINNNSDSDNNGNRNNVLTYISSHDTRLSRWSNQDELGTMFVLLPGGVQIYYGDETAREKAYADCGDGDMATRGDFDWSQADGACAKHWGKVGTFRKFNPAVGAGTGSATKRTYNGAAGSNKVAIGISGTSVDVSDLFADGTTVYNWYDGNHSTVSGGKVTFAGGTMKQPILVSEKNPADYGVSF